MNVMNMNMIKLMINDEDDHFNFYNRAECIWWLPTRLATRRMKGPPKDFLATRWTPYDQCISYAVWLNWTRPEATTQRSIEPCQMHRLCLSQDWGRTSRRKGDRPCWITSFSWRRWRCLCPLLPPFGFWWQPCRTLILIRWLPSCFRVCLHTNYHHQGLAY